MVIGNWKLETGNWKLAVRIAFVAAYCLLPTAYLFSQTTPVKVQSAYMGNGTTVIDASSYAGSTLDVKVAAAIAACPSVGCIVDARGLGGAQSLAATVTYSSASNSVTLVLGAGTITRASGKQFLLGSNGRLICSGGPCIITGNDSTAAVGGVYSGGAPSQIEVRGLTIKNSGVGACVDFISTSAGSLSARIHDNIFDCATAVLTTGYWNRIRNNTIGANPSNVFWAGVVMDDDGGGQANSNQVEDNVIGPGGNGTGVFMRSGSGGYNNLESFDDFEGTNLAVFVGTHSSTFLLNADNENNYCGSRTGWAATTAYGRGAVIWDGTNCELDVTADSAGYSTTSGSSTPSWPSTEGSTVTDGGVTWEMYKNGGGGTRSPFLVIGSGARGNVVSGMIGDNPNIEDIDYVLNGYTTNTIDTQGNARSGTSGTQPYGIGVGPYGLSFISGSGTNQPGLGQTLMTFNLLDYVPGSGPSSLLNGASLDIPLAGNECSTYGYCGHGSLRLGELYDTAGAQFQGPTGFYALPTPAAPTVTVVGTPGTATCTYYLVAHVNGGATLPSSATTITNCPNTLNGTNYALITVPATIGSSVDPWSNATWDVLKGDTAHSLYAGARLSANNAADQGGSLSAYTPPPRNSTGDVIFAATLPSDGSIPLCTDPSHYLSTGCTAGAGVSSVAQTMPSFFAVGGSPVTGAGTLADTYATGLTSNENQVLSVDGSGNAGLRALTTAMLPNAVRYGTCDLPVGDTSGSAITNAQLGPQSRICLIPAAATIVEMDVNADAGTPSVIVGRNHAGTIANIVSSALATAASGGIACSNTGGTTGINGATTCSSTLQNTSLAAGDYLELVSGTAGGTAKFFVAHVIYIH